jgi:muconolactone delta-isomerase
VSAHIRTVPNITLSVPEDLHRRMRRHPEVQWSEVVRRVIAAKIRDLEAMDRLTAKSLLTQDDVDELDHVLKAAPLRRYRRRSEG